MQNLYYNEVQVVIDIDLENFFGTINLKLLEKILREKIQDKTLMRYVIRMFKAGVLSNGELRVSPEVNLQPSACEYLCTQRNRCVGRGNGETKL